MGKELLVEAYIYKPEIKSPPGLVIKVLSGEEKKIHSVKLFKADDSPITADTVLKYNQTIKVKVHTQNMPEEFLKLTLYEDDAKGGGHNAINEQNKVAEITKRTNKNGFLWHEFKLKADFSKIANAIMDGSSDKHHEYYVLVESAKYGSKSSRNANVENPDYIKTQTVSASSNKIYYGTPIKEVVVKGRLKKQVGIDPMPKTGKSMSKVAQQEKEQTKEEEKKIEESNADIEFHIKSSGQIQYKILNKKREKASYFYYDTDENIHYLGNYKLKKVKDNYGGIYKDKLEKDSENIYLVDFREVKKSYLNGSVGYSITINTSRYYMNDVTLAALLGAMLECNYHDFTFNGFSNERGESVGGSKSHKNGMNGDFRYLRKDKQGGITNLFNNDKIIGWKGLDEHRQNEFNIALYKFGWKSMLSQNYGKNKERILNHCMNDKNNNHNDHLHIQGFNPKLKEID